MTISWYSTIAPGIAFGLVMPLTGSDRTNISFTTVSGTARSSDQVQVTELSSGIWIWRESPDPVTAIGSESASRTQARPML